MSEAKTYVVLPDQQIPWHDRELHQVVLRVLSDIKPHGLILSGDITDKPQFSLKYPWNHHMVSDPISSVRNHQRTAREVIYEYVEAAGSEDNWIVPGNHDDRFINYVAAKAPLLMAIDDVAGDALISLDSYLDATGAGYTVAVDPAGMASYPAANVVLGKHVAIYHGWLLGNGKPGASAYAHLDYLSHSVIVGHSHKVAKVHKTLWNIRNEPEVIVGIESGTLAMVKGGLGHTVRPNWQQAITFVTVFSDGQFTADPALYTDHSLFHNGERWHYTKRGITRG